MRIRVRARTQYEKDGKVIEHEIPRECLTLALGHALTLDRGEMRWDNTDEIACLDIDDAPEPERLTAMLAVSPALAWVSRSGSGLHAIYHEAEGFKASEIAWLAALPIIESRAEYGVEVLPRSAVPPFPPLIGEQGEIRAYVKRISAQVTDDQRSEYLNSRGMHVGARYPHTKCPIRPELSSGSNPVVVNEEGVYCFRCQAGRDYAYLIHGKRYSLTELAARAAVHWTHADYIIKHEFPLIAKRDNAAKSFYSALVKAYFEPDDPRIARIYNPKLQFVRFRGYWADSETFEQLTGYGQSLFVTLPWIQHCEKDDTGKWETTFEPTRKGIVTSNANLTGYAPIIPTRGIQLWGIHNEYPDSDAVRACIPVKKKRPPRYLPVASRMPHDDAWKVLEKSFPGVDRKYLTLLVAGRAIAESGYGAVPIVLASGPSGSGKSFTVSLAAELLGDEVRSIQPTTAKEKFETFFIQHVGSGCGFIRLDEYIKLLSKESQIREKFEPLLTVEREYDGNRMYVGTVRAKVNSLLVVCSLEFPAWLLNDSQISRRVVHIRLTETVPNWRNTSGGIEGWREREDSHAHAANSLISYIADAYLNPGIYPDLRNVAKLMDIEVIDASDPNADHNRDVAARIMALWAACAESRADTAGWIECEKIRDNPVTQAWRNVCDDPFEQWGQIHGIASYDLHKLCGFAPGTVIETRTAGGKLNIRFIVTPIKRGSGKNVFNGMIPISPREVEPPPAPVTETPKEVPAMPVADAVIIDLETRSRSNLTDDGGRRYAAHESTEIFCGAAYIGDEYYTWHHVPDIDTPGYCLKGTLPKAVRQSIGPNTLIMAHNANGFDRHVWNRFYGVHDNWLDTLDLARANGHSRVKLDELGEDLYGLGKDERGQRLLPMYSQPTRSGAFARFTNDVLSALIEYNKRDVEILVNALNDGHLATVEMPDWERDVIEVTRRMNERGFKVDKQLAAALLRVETVRANTARSSVGELAQLLTSHAKLKTYLNEHGFAIPDVQADTLRGLLNGDYDAADGSALSPEIVNVINARLNTNSPTVSKCRRVLTDAGTDDRMRDTLAYHSAHTGRWGGRGFQPQNLARIEMDRERLYNYIETLLVTPEYIIQNLASIEDIDTIQSQTPRTLIIAEKGNVLIAIDYKQIEARVAAFLAGQSDMVSAFAKNEPLYEMTAAEILGIPLASVTKEQRQVGKVARLAGNYQMGGAGYARFCAAQGIDLAKMRVDPNDFIKKYRKTIPDITATWKTLHNTVYNTVECGNDGYAAGCNWVMRNGHLICALPSGRCNVYRDAKIEDVVPIFNRDITIPTVTYQARGHRKSLYGGLEFENVVQAYSRDLLAIAMVRAEESDILPVLCVHDELVCEVPAAKAEHAAKQLASIMLDLPEWATGLPIGLDIIPPGWRYGK